MTATNRREVVLSRGDRRSWAARSLLIALVGMALFLRTYHLDWAEGQLPHPDERSTVAFYAPTIHWPQSLAEALDPRRSPLNPFWDPVAQHRRSYTYGHFPLYLLVLTANGLARLAPLARSLGVPPETAAAIARLNTVPGFAVVGRALMALADTLTVFLVYLVARRLYGEWWALLATAFITFAVTHVQLAHFFAVDPMATTFVMLAVYGTMRLLETGRARDAVLTGVGVALAVGSKFSALPILAVVGIGVGYGGVVGRWRLGKGGARRYLILGVMALVTAGILFALTSPFVILDWPNFKQAVLVEQGAMVRGDADLPFTRQYRGTTPYLYHIEQSVKWGLGWGLGLLAWTGLAWAFWKALRRRLQPGEWLLLAWVVFYFGPTGLFLAKFMRYTLPIVPVLILFAVGLLRDMATSGRTIAGRPLFRWLSYTAAGLALGHAVFWSAAFVNGVYGHTHTWILASRWIYAHVPDAAVLATEHWDDRLPLPLPEPNANPGRYRYVTMPMYDEDTAGKFELIKRNLRQADYYVFASGRLYRTIPRLPERYPMTTRFYELFFAEKLGFVRVLEVTSYPRLGPFVFPDDSADESFWVYDHPRVLIYKKVRDLSDEEWDRLLGGTWQGARHWYVPETLLQKLFRYLPFGQPSPRPPDAGRRGGPSLLLDRPFEQLPVVRFWRWNRWASEHTVPAVILWWLALGLIGWMAWPMTYLTFGWLYDRGYAFSKGLGLLMIAYLAWIVPSLRLWVNDLPLILAVIGAFAALNALLARRFRRPLAAFLARRWRLLLFYEGLFGAAFLLFVFIRLLNPDLWHPWNGGEKFMEIAFLNAVVRSPYFPPYDPYFAGGTINYYYWGYQIVNVLVKLTGITPTVAFNLAVPTFFALTVTGACGLVYNMAWPIAGRRARWVGLIGAAFVAFFGNPDGTVEILRNLAEVSGSGFRSPTFPWLETLVQAVQGLTRVVQGAAPLPKYNYWNPSRVIPYTINEFPYWSFLFADLHPHLMAIPFTIVFLGLALNALYATGKSWLAGRDDWPSPLEPGRQAVYGVAQLAALPLVLGALAVINTWDLPTYFGILGAVFFLRQWRATGRVDVRKWLLQMAAVLGIALALFRPFFAHYAATAASGVGWAPQKTSLGLWLNIWALWFFLAVSFLAVEIPRRDPLGLARWLRLVVLRYDRLPRVLALHRALVGRPSGSTRDGDAVPTLAATARGWQPVQVRPQGGIAADSRVGYAVGRGLLALSVPVGVFLWVLGYRVPAVILVPLVAAAVLTLRLRAPEGVQFAVLLTFTALLVLLGVEFFYLKDHLQGGEFKRMNTLFKFYIQAWVLLALAAAVGLWEVRPRLPRWRRSVRGLWQVTFGVLTAASLTFLVVGTAARVDDRFPRAISGRPPFGTLDGMAYMKYGVYTWPDMEHRIELKWDYEAIRWLLDNVPEVVPIAEARLDYYREGGTRVASFTGLPTFLGLHQIGEQRYGWQTGPRQQIALEFWHTPDINRTLEIIREIGIRYIYVGQLERQQYPPAALAKFDRMVEMGLLEVVYDNPGVRIYRVVTDAG